MQPAEGADANAEPLLAFRLEHHDSPLSQLRERGGNLPDFPDRLPAREIPAPAAGAEPAWVPLPVTADVQLDGRPLVWLAADGSGVAVDARAFSDLTCVDAGRIPQGGVVLGKCLVPDRLAPRQVARLLIQADAVRANIHTHADVKLLQELPGYGGTYRSVWESEATYFTNQRNVATMRFVIEVERDGTLRVSKG